MIAAFLPLIGTIVMLGIAAYKLTRYSSNLQDALRKIGYLLVGALGILFFFALTIGFLEHMRDGYIMTAILSLLATGGVIAAIEQRIEWK
jgi:hypothetical protein